MKGAHCERPIASPMGGAPPARWNHYAEHGRGVGAWSEQEYDESARRTIQDGRRFEYRERNGVERVGYYDMRRGLLTCLQRDERRITSHFAASEAYARRLRDSTYS